jgi:6-phosphogluconolactonase
VNERQDQPHLHAAILSKDERYLYCSDLGADRLYRFAYRPGAAVPLHTTDPPYMELPPGSGPRHLALSPDGRRLYLITELSGDIFVFDANEFNTGWLQKVSLLQEGFTGKIEAADIQINHSGSHLYASARGDANEVIVFSVEVITGQLKFLQRIFAEGLSPRSLLLCEQQDLLLAANEQSDNVSIFKVRSDGTLQNDREQLRIPCPTCVKAMADN